jgi:hypothetical protein
VSQRLPSKRVHVGASSQVKVNTPA